MAYNQFPQGRGEIDNTIIAQPAVGAIFTFTVPVGKVYRLNSIKFRLTTSAVAGNRNVLLRFYDASSNILYYAYSDVDQAASQGYNYNATLFGSHIAAKNNTVQFSLPLVYLPAGYIFNCQVVNIDAGDQLDLIYPSWEVWRS